MQQTRPLAAISDDELLRRLAELLAQNRRVESDLVAHIAEVDERRLYARYAAPSMFAYCTEVLHLSEAEAYLRTTAARASRQHPVLLEMLADGRLHLSGIVLLAPFLTVENRDALLARATNRSKQQIKELIAEIAPQPDAPAVMRRLPERRALPTPASPLHMGGVPSSAASAVSEASGLGPRDVMATPSGMGKNVTPGSGRFPVQPAWPSPRDAERLRQVIQPLSPSRYKVQFTASAELHDKLERLRALLRSEVPDGDLGAIIEQAVSEKLARLEARRFASTSRPRKVLSKTDVSPSSRHIPAAVRRSVRERDGSRCCYVDGGGRRCSERGLLEYHHRHPFGLGGDHSLKNLRLMCHAHNSYLAEHDYGREAMARHRRPSHGGSGKIAMTSIGSPLTLVSMSPRGT